jgi:hypothetical protein
MELVGADRGMNLAMPYRRSVMGLARVCFGRGWLILVEGSPPHLDEAVQAAVELVAPDGHLDGVERVLHDVVGVQLIYFLHHGIDIGLLRLSEKEELCARLRLEALDPELAGL